MYISLINKGPFSIYESFLFTRVVFEEREDGRTSSLDSFPGDRSRPAGHRIPERPATFVDWEETNQQNAGITVNDKKKGWGKELKH